MAEDTKITKINQKDINKDINKDIKETNHIKQTNRHIDEIKLDKNQSNKKESDKNDKEFNIDISSTNFKKLTKYLPILILVLILAFGFWLRVYHVDHPVVGYHNWKEVHYLTEARNFAQDGFFENGFFVPEWSYPRLEVGTSGLHGDVFPVLSIVIGLAFMLFGDSLTLARIITILFNLGTIVFAYLILRKLFNERYGLIVAFLMALCPLFVFFGRNVQIINSGIFFILASFYFYLNWVSIYTKKYSKNLIEIDNLEKNNADNSADNKNTGLYDLKLYKKANRNLIYACICLILAAFSKYTMLIWVIPILFVFPYRQFFTEVNTKIKQKISFKSKLNSLKYYLVSILILLLVPVHLLYSRSIEAEGKIEILSSSNINLGVFFESQFWNVIKSYVSDNYTLLGLLFMFLGIVLFVYFFKSKYNDNKLGYKFLLGSLVSIPIFMFVMSSKLSGHSYHQYPVAPFVIFFVGYFIYVLSSVFSNYGKSKRAKKIIFIAFVILFCFLLIKPSFEAKDRQFSVQFIGVDVAGEYIKENSKSDETFFHSAHQDYGIIWHSERKGFYGSIANVNVQDLMYAEENYNSNWIFIYNWAFNVFENQELMQHISSNYRLKQFGYVQSGENIIPVYFLLQKGGTFNPNELNNLINGKRINTKVYETPLGNNVLNYINM